LFNKDKHYNVYIPLQQFNTCNMNFQAYNTQVISVDLLVNFPKSQSSFLQQFRSER